MKEVFEAGEARTKTGEGGEQATKATKAAQAFQKAAEGMSRTMIKRETR
jgi:hypothetical protein